MMTAIPPKLCRACRVRPADSDEHVFHSALGGTIRIPNVLCTSCNNDLGRTVDAATVEQFNFFRSALEISGDRGQTPEFSAQHPEHGKLNIEQGLRPRLAARKPEMQNLEGGNVQAKVASETIAKQILASQRRKSADVNVLSAEQEIVPPPTVEFRIALGGENFRRSCLKVTLVFIEHLELVPSVALHGVWDYVRHGRPVSTLRFAHTPHFSAWQLPATMSEFSHQLMIEPPGEGRPLRAALSIFGCPLFMAELPVESVGGQRAAIAEDPINHHRQQATDFPPLPAIPASITADIAESFKKQLGRVIEAKAILRDERAMTEMAQLACRPLFDDLKEGEPITEEVIRKVVQRAAALMTGRQFGETVTLEDPRLLTKLKKQ